jgi:hypothetical protein
MSTGVGTQVHVLARQALCNLNLTPIPKQEINLYLIYILYTGPEGNFLQYFQQLHVLTTTCHTKSGVVFSACGIMLVLKNLGDLEHFGFWVFS